MVIVICPVNPCVCHTVSANLCIIIGNIKSSAIAKAFAPAVLTQKRTVFRWSLRKILRRIIIIPSNDQNVMVHFILSIIIVGSIFRIIVFRCHFCPAHIHIDRALNGSVPVNHFFDRIKILIFCDLNFLHMFYRRKTFRCNTVSIRIHLFGHRSLPRRQIGDCNVVGSSLFLTDCIAVLCGNVICRKNDILLRQQP